MDHTNCKSEVARLIRQIDAEYDAMHQGLSGLANGAAKHVFIHVRMSYIGNHHKKLVALVGENIADDFLCQANDASIERWNQQNETTI